MTSANHNVGAGVATRRANVVNDDPLQRSNRTAFLPLQFGMKALTVDADSNTDVSRTENAAIVIEKNPKFVPMPPQPPDAGTPDPDAGTNPPLDDLGPYGGARLSGVNYFGFRDLGPAFPQRRPLTMKSSQPAQVTVDASNQPTNILYQWTESTEGQLFEMRIEFKPESPGLWNLDLTATAREVDGGSVVSSKSCFVNSGTGCGKDCLPTIDMSARKLSYNGRRFLPGQPVLQFSGAFSY
jgi:hypothetical protein